MNPKGGISISGRRTSARDKQNRHSYYVEWTEMSFMRTSSSMSVAAVPIPH